VLQQWETVAVPVVVLGELHSGFRAGTQGIENELDVHFQEIPLLLIEPRQESPKRS
jgi:hypothetical protein